MQLYRVEFCYCDSVYNITIMHEANPAQTQNRHESVKLSELHPDFKIESGKWVFNHFWNSAEQGDMQMKVRAGFDDAFALDNISHSAKIGVNTDPAVHTKYIAFIYGESGDLESLRALAEKFPYSEIIHDIAPTGVTKERSRVEVING